MEILRPKDWVYPKDIELIDTDTKGYIQKLIRAINEIYSSVRAAFKRIQLSLESVMNLETNAFKLTRVSQADEPTLESGQLMIWRDSDDGKIYLVFNDPDSGQKKVEMT